MLLALSWTESAASLFLWAVSFAADLASAFAEAALSPALPAEQGDDVRRERFVLVYSTRRSSADVILVASNHCRVSSVSCNRLGIVLAEAAVSLTWRASRRDVHQVY